jgi:hypothetical protein
MDVVIDEVEGIVVPPAPAPPAPPPAATGDAETVRRVLRELMRERRRLARLEAR